MRTLLRLTALSLSCVVLLAAGRATADDAADAKLFERVMSRLLSSDCVRSAYPDKFVWPPKYGVQPHSAAVINAYASAHEVHGATVDKDSGKIRPVVLVTEGMLHKVIEGDENGLAIIMGHELAHLARDHVSGRKGETAVTMLAFSRDQEIEADLDGLRFAIAAGYPYRSGVSLVTQKMRKLSGRTSFEGLSSTHPTWEERLAMLDRNQAKLWTSMSAFQNGAIFLQLEQYLPAKKCFQAVVAEFPDCYEAWANIGYTQLMQYCDGLDADDLAQLDIGQIVAGAFYARPDSLEGKVRGMDEKLWKEAVQSLKKALALNPNLVLPRANLGVAYLVHPEGKHAKEASKWFNEAIECYKKDPQLEDNPQAAAALFVNAGVADLARGDTVLTELQFKAARGLAREEGPTRLMIVLNQALMYNQALLDLRSSDPAKKHRALELLQRYLLSASPDAAWWTLAYNRYEKLCKELGEKPVSRTQMAVRILGPSMMRLVTSVPVGGEAIALSESLAPVVERLGKGVAVPLYPESKLVRWHFEAQGIDLLGKDKVVAIFLTSVKAPPVTVQAIGVGTKARELRVGMSEADAKEVLKGQYAQASPVRITDPGVEFTSYPQLGVAVRFAHKHVEQIVIAQVPRWSLAKK